MIRALASSSGVLWYCDLLTWVMKRSLQSETEDFLKQIILICELQVYLVFIF